MKWIKLKLLVLTVFAVSIAAAGEYVWQLTADKKDAIYKKGEKIIFSCQLTDDGKVPVGATVRYVVIADSKPNKTGKFVISEKPWIYMTSLDYPGWVRIHFYLLDKHGKTVKHQVLYRGKMVKRDVSGGIGALIEPDKLYPAKAEPADFDQYWADVKAELAKVPVQELERVEVPCKQKSAAKKVVVYDVKIACAGGKPVSGYLVMPRNAKPKSCPVHVTFHGAGVVSARQQIAPALHGVITLDVNAHGIVNGQPKDFYQNLRKNFYYRSPDGKSEGRYAHWHNDNRDEYYFRGMYMRVMRALEYAKSLPEWDGKTLIVSGASQGGAQVIAACALDQDITIARAGVPAMCDHSGVLATPSRNSGWPRHYKAVNGKPDNPAVAECVAYFDGCYFAKRIRCPIYINTGLIDNTCVPTSVFAMYNSIPATTEKHMTVAPDKGHAGVPYDDFRNAVKTFYRK